MAGSLTIHSSGAGTGEFDFEKPMDLLSGHSWIEYTPDGGTPTTYGTWGNNPGGLGNGLHRNLEAGRSSDASRTVHLDDAQEAALMNKIKEYEDKGKDGWGNLNPCSSFAADAWETATGEDLDHRTGIISNPSKLKQSINTSNGLGTAVAAPIAPPRPSSSSSVRAPVVRCTSSGG